MVGRCSFRHAGLSPKIVLRSTFVCTRPHLASFVVYTAHYLCRLPFISPNYGLRGPNYNPSEIWNVETRLGNEHEGKDAMFAQNKDIFPLL